MIAIIICGLIVECEIKNVSNDGVDTYTIIKAKEKKTVTVDFFCHTHYHCLHLILQHGMG